MSRLKDDGDGTSLSKPVEADERDGEEARVVGESSRFSRVAPKRGNQKGNYVVVPTTLSHNSLFDFSLQR
jgi:hypothetical protein